MRRILIVSDTLFTTVSASFLDRRSFKVRLVESPLDALPTIAVWEPALILFSSHLEQLPAADFCRMIRADAKLSETKLLMVSKKISGDTIQRLGWVRRRSSWRC